MKRIAVDVRLLDIKYSIFNIQVAEQRYAVQECDATMLIRVQMLGTQKKL